MNSDDTRETFSIGQLARLTGVGAKAIRFYESIGLLPVPGRSENGYRRYATEDINRVRLLHRMRLLGLPLAVTKPLVAAAAEARCAEIRSELLTLVDRRLVDIDREIAALRASRIEVDRYRRALDTICLNEEEFFRACQDATCIMQPDICLKEDALMTQIACCDQPCPCDGTGCCDEECCSAGCC